MTSDAAVALLASRYQTTVIDIATRNTAVVTRLWRAFGGVDDAAADTFTQRAAAVTLAHQRQAAALAVAYVNAAVGISTGEPVTTSVDIGDVVARARNGVALTDVYLRPVITARTILGETGDIVAALRAGLNRATSAADIDVKLAARGGARDAMTAAGVTHYRRMPNAKACTFCLTASTQRYKTADLMSLHVRCGCSVAPIAGDVDPGRVINKDLLARLKASTGRSDYWNDPKAATAVHQHGELGPVLTHAGDAFSSLADL